MPHAFEGVFDSRPHPHGQPFVPFDFGDDTYTPGKIYSIRRRVRDRGRLMRMPRSRSCSAHYGTVCAFGSQCG
jgi:hypothetical protein